MRGRQRVARSAGPGKGHVGLARGPAQEGICSRSGGVEVYWIMNKPGSLVTTVDDEKGRETVYAKLPAGLPWMGPVGRLDKASEGLLLFTNDTEWAARITAPESHLEKTYSVQYRTAEADWVLQNLRAGVKSSDGE